MRVDASRMFLPRSYALKDSCHDPITSHSVERERTCQLLTGTRQDRLAQCSTGAMQPDFNGAVTEIEDASHLLDAHLLHVPQHEHAAVEVRQALDRSLQQVPQL